MAKKKYNGYFDVWIFSFCLLALAFFGNWLPAARYLAVSKYSLLFGAGALGFVFQLFMQRKPLVELYSKGHPYRKLKIYGLISAFLLFEYVLIWGLNTRQILVSQGEDLFLVTVVFVGAIAYYHTFIRMRISLRFLFLAILIPTIGAGAALGLGSYFKILKFIVPLKQIGDIVFFDTLYWILFSIFIQTVCEEPAFRGYLMQRLLPRGEIFAIIISTAVFAVWRLLFVIFLFADYIEILLTLAGALITGAIFALLFIKGRNLLVAILCHGIMNGLYNSFFASSAYPGIKQYFDFLAPDGEFRFIIIWYGCLLIGLILLTFIPRKKFNVS